MLKNEFKITNIKDIIFNPKKRFLCHTCFCGNEDGYCPTYECGLKERLKKYTKRQWNNAIEEINRHDIHLMNQKSEDDYIEDVLDALLRKRPRKAGK